LVLRESVDHHKQDELRHCFTRGPAAGLSALQFFLDQLKGIVEIQIIRLAIGADRALDFKLVVIELHLAARAALFLER
jgi:hypothetical protein